MATDSITTIFRRAPLTSKLRLGLIMFLGFGIVGVSGYSIFVLMTTESRLEAKRAAGWLPAHHPEAKAFTYVYELDNISFGTTSKRTLQSSFVQFALTLDCPTPESLRAMELNRASIRDAIYQVGNRFDVEELSGPVGIHAFKKALLKEFRIRFGSLAPRAVAIRNWLVA